jgi:hypothetical protein
MDAVLPTSLPSGMTPSRSRYAPADESRIPHWLVTYDVFRNVLASKPLAIGADLRAAMRQAFKGVTRRMNGPSRTMARTVSSSAIAETIAERYAFNPLIHLRLCLSTTLRPVALAASKSPRKTGENYAVPTDL